MIALLLAVLCSSSIALLFKFSETRKMNRYALTSANYAVATAVSLVLVGRATVLRPGWPEFGPSLAALGLGSVTGVLFLAGYLLYQENVKRHGASLAGAFGKLGIIVAVALSLVIWGESGGLAQKAAIVLSVAAVVIANLPQGKDWRRSLRLLLIALAITGGTAEYMHAVFERQGLVDHLPVFLLGAFATALLLCLALQRRSRRKVRPGDLLMGVAVGLPNLGSSAFLVTALTTLDAAVVYAVFGAGTVLVIALAAWLIYGEQPDARGRIAIGLTAAALVVMQLPF